MYRHSTVRGGYQTAFISYAWYNTSPLSFPTTFEFFIIVYLM